MGYLVSSLWFKTQVDVFGKCGSGRGEDCPATVERDYMFYLSFENSLCDQGQSENDIRSERGGGLKGPMVDIVRKVAWILQCRLTYYLPRFN